jgi:hypothetical protein
MNSSEAQAILDHYNMELTAYSKQVADGVNAAVNRGRQPLASHIDGLTRIFVFLSWLVDKGFLSQAPLSVKALFAQLANSVFAVRACFFEGYPAEAISVARTLFEAAVNLDLLLEDDVIYRSWLHENYRFIDAERALRKWREMLEKALITPEQFQRQYPEDKILRIVAEADAVRHHYRPKRPSEWSWKVFFPETEEVITDNGRKKLPGDPGILEKATRVGHLHAYLGIYHPFSGVTHASVVQRAFLSDIPGGELKVGPKFPGIGTRIARTSISMALKPIPRLLTYLEVPERDDLLIFILGLLNGSEETVSDLTPGA